MELSSTCSVEIVTKRVALVTVGFFDAGGIGRSARFMYEVLKNLGFQVDIFDLATASHDIQSRKILKPRTWLKKVRLTDSETTPPTVLVGANFVELEPMRYRPRKSFTNILNSYDLVQGVFGSPAWAYTLSKVSSKKVIQIASTTKLERESYGGIKGKSLKALGRRLSTKITIKIDAYGIYAVDKVLAMNNELARYCEDQFKIATGVEVLSPGILNTMIGAERDWNPRGPIISIGRLGDPRKAWPRLLQSYKRLMEFMPDAPKLVIVGTGIFESSCQQIVQDLVDSEKIIIKTGISDSELLTTLQEASVFIQASYEEGLGLAALEALANGVPVVVSETFGAEEYVVSGVNGYTVSQHNGNFEDEFAKSIREILITGTPNLSKIVRDGVVGRFTIDATAKRLKRILDDK